MVAVNRKYLTLEGGAQKVRESQGDEVIFTVVRIGGTGGQDLKIVGGKWDFAGVALSNIAAGSASGEAVEFDQLTTALGDYQLTSEKGEANGYASLDGGGKVPVGQLPSAVMTYEGVWNATTNSPELEDGTGDAGMVYRVGTAGSQDLGSGSISFDVGDYVIYNGTIWQKSDTTDAVASVNGLTGIVVLDTDDIDEGAANFYYTEDRFDTSFGGKDTDDLDEGATNKYFSVAAAKAAAVADAIVNGVTDVAPSQNAVFDALANKSAVGHTHVASDVTDFTAAAKAAAVANAIVDGVTDVAPSQEAVFEALALKADASSVPVYFKTLENSGAGTATIRAIVAIKDVSGTPKFESLSAAGLSDDYDLGIVKDASILAAASGGVWYRIGAIVPGFTGLTPGKKVYVHNSTAGSFTQDPSTISAGNHLYMVGRAISATEIQLAPRHIAQM